MCRKPEAKYNIILFNYHQLYLVDAEKSIVRVGPPESETQEVPMRRIQRASQCPQHLDRSAPRTAYDVQGLHALAPGKCWFHFIALIMGH